MRFSLVVATLNRTTELQTLMASLARQTHRDFEVIVVDQNTDDRLLPILKPFKDVLEIRHMESAPGLSKARNVGLRSATGDVICFPDDDCWYADNLLEHVNQSFVENPNWDGLIGDSVDETGQPTLPWRDRSGKVTLAKCWRRAVTYALFFRRRVMREVRGFDEMLGPGTNLPWGCGEDNDFVLRALKTGAYVQYERSVRVFHPKMFLSFDEQGCAKRHRYAMGDGKLLQKHPMPIWWQMLFFFVPLCRASVASVKLDANEFYFHWLTFRGRLAGFLSSETPARPGSLAFSADGGSRELASVQPLKAFSAAAGTK